MNKENFIFFGDEIIASYCGLLIFAAIYITYKLKFPQVRFLFLALKILSGAMDHKGSKGQIVHSQAFSAGTASSLLPGAILGSALAMMIGGVGALFWIWVGSFLIMPLRAVSSTLAIRFRTKLPNGRYLAGPMYFIEKALKARWLAIAFSIGCILTVLSLGGVIPVLSMTYVAKEAFDAKGLGLSIALIAIVIFIVLGGIRRIGRVSGVIVPTGLILFFGFYFLIFNETLIPFTQFIGVVFHNAFNFEAIGVGSLLSILVYIGQSSGVFFLSTEMGLGKSAGISGAVRTDHAFKQGLVSMLSAFFEGFIVSTLIFYLLFSANAVGLEDQMFFLKRVLHHGKDPYYIIFYFSFFLFCIASIIGWFYTGEQSAYYILGEKFANLFRIVFFGVVISSSYLFLREGNYFIELALNAGYTMALFTAIPILISLILLVKMVGSEMNKYLTEGGVRYEIFKDIYLLILSALPKNLISKLFGSFTYLRLPRFMMVPILKAFAKAYKINVSEAELNIKEYNSLNQFFTRALKAGARIIDSAENAVVSPVDARITSFGDINDDTLIQAKGFDYSVKELLGSEKYYPFFNNGKFITFYLSPQDYHRIHSPFYGKILGYYYAPGKLFPVNDAAVGGIRGLFPKNERLI
ncbi:MAG TPA: archaetidylserine decarboxylase, partial [Leptospiraceae bacterium]|nr:archaetidylserine decarboxylase [Leptospiraceae bacterium]